jgi:hypothetical protein
MCVNSDVGYSNLPITFRVLIILSFNEMSECRVGLVVFVQDKFDMASEEPSIFEFGSQWKKKKIQSPTAKLCLFGPFVEWNYLDFEGGHPLQFYESKSS